MATITVTAPNVGYNGVSAGVRFVDGKAEVDERNFAALEYFGRHRFGISEAVKSKEDEVLDIPKAAAPVDQTDAKALAKLTREELDKIAGQRGLDVSEAKNKTEVAELIAAATTTPQTGATATETQAGLASTGTTDVAGDGPAGALHNLGHDGANPAGAEPPVTPSDAGI